MIELPIVHNWAKPLSETITFKTAVFRTRNGSEFRRSDQVFYRRYLDFSFWEKGEKADSVFLAMQKYRAKRPTMVDPLKSAPLPSGMAAGDAAVGWPSAPDWVVTGETLQIGAEVVTVLDYTDPVLTLGAAVSADHPAGEITRRVMRVLMEGKPSIRYLTGELLSGSIRVLEDPGSFSPEEPAWAEQFNGLDVIHIDHNWRKPLQVQIASEHRNVDFGGAIDIVDSEGFTADVWNALYTDCSSRSNAQIMRDFFIKQKGKRGSFYAPTGLGDLTPVSGVVGGSSAIVVEGINAADLVSSDPTKGAIVVQTFAGERHYAEVFSASISGQNSVLSTSVWPAAVSLQDIHRISWMHKSRFARDSVKISWHTNSVSELTLSPKTLRIT